MLSELCASLGPQLLRCVEHGSVLAVVVKGEQGQDDAEHEGNRLPEDVDGDQDKHDGHAIQEVEASVDQGVLEYVVHDDAPMNGWNVYHDRAAMA